MAEKRSPATGAAVTAAAKAYGLQSKRRRATLFGLCAAVGLLVGCRSNEPLPPVFGAVFGVSGAAVTPFTQGRIPEPVVGEDDRLIGAAASNPGSCIWQDQAGRRFRAACPQGSDGLSGPS